MNMVLGRVVGVHPKSHSIDVVVMGDNRRIPGVKVMSGSAGSDFGFSDLAEPDATGYDARTSSTRNVLAVLCWVSGVPVAMGFLPPTDNQVAFDEKGRMVYRHGSDVYMTIDKAGNAELAHPSGAYIRIGEDPEHEDLSGKDYNGKWGITRNTDKKAHIRIGVGGFTFTVSPDGSLAVKAPAGTTIESDVAIKGKLTVESDIEAGGDVVGGGISLKDHLHGNVQAGPAKTGKPE